MQRLNSREARKHSSDTVFRAFSPPDSLELGLIPALGKRPGFQERGQNRGYCPSGVPGKDPAPPHSQKIFRLLGKDRAEKHGWAQSLGSCCWPA